MGSLLSSKQRPELVATELEIEDQPDEINIHVSIGRWYLTDFLTVSSQWVEDTAIDLVVSKQIQMKDFIIMICNSSTIKTAKELDTINYCKISLEAESTVEASVFDYSKTDPVEYVPLKNNMDCPIVRRRIFNNSSIKFEFPQLQIAQDTII